MSGQHRNPLLKSNYSAKLDTKSSLLSTSTTIVSKKPKTQKKEHVTDDGLQLTRQLSEKTKPISTPSIKLVGTAPKLSDKYAVSTNLNDEKTSRKTSAQTTTRAKPDTLLKSAKPITLKSSNLQTKSLLLSATKSGLLATKKPPTAPPLTSSLRSSPRLSHASTTSSKKYSTSLLTSSYSTSSAVTTSLKKTQPTHKTLSQPLVKSALNAPTKQRDRQGATGRDDTDDAAAPHYELKLETSRNDREDEVETFLPPELDPSIHEPPAPTIGIVQVKHNLVNCVAASLLKQPDFQDNKNATRVMLHQLATATTQFDAEFVLKVALYTRRDLNIRTTANFLLALASNMHGCRPFLKKYYSAVIRLPSDWIEVAEIYTSFHDCSLNFGSLPTSLRKVMIDRFSSFDMYQLAKYNKDSKKSQKGKQPVKDSKGTKQKEKAADKKTDDTDGDTDGDTDDSSSVVSDDKSETEEELEHMSFTLKQLIRKLHISEPAEAVMGLIGKKYPEDRDEFRRSKLQGVWDEERAGKRMKLPTPETWETQVSSKGNKASTWEALIDHKKLPFMAMLRNLRNLILAGVSEKHHKWVLKKLTDEGSVINSQQFPFRFFSAYEVLNQLEKAKNEGVLQGSKARVKKKALSKTAEEKYKKQIGNLDVGLLSRYRKALDAALKISTSYNVKPIAGSTLIICYLDKDTDAPCTSARGLGKPRTVLEVIILLALMCKYACEHSVLLLCGPHGEPLEMELEDGTILENMERILKHPLAKPTVVSADKNYPMTHLHQLIHTQTHIDSLILLQGSQSGSSMKAEKEMSKFLKNYRRFVNAGLLYVDVDVSGSSDADPASPNPTRHRNDVHLSGFSDNILRFIAERGGSGQMTYIENIDKAYDLKSVKSIGLVAASSDVPSLSPEKALLTAGQPKIWRTVRVFISSTFRDMHGERDLLTRFVFPELRARAHSRCIQIYEADLRWGVTEEDARSARALEICLGEISRSHYFIGMLGQRYGWVQDKYMVPDLEEYDWIREYPTHRSITELEMYHGALADPEKAMKKAFFFFRDKAFLSEVPEQHIGSFVSSSFEDECKIEGLKSRIRESGLEVYDKYPARWFGVAEGKPMAGGLEDFGYRVLNVLWNRIQKDFPLDDPNRDAMIEANNLHMATMESFSETFVGRRELLQEAMAVLQSNKHRIIVGCGKPGSGKSAFMAALAQLYIESLTVKTTNLVIPHFIGAAPNSGNIAAILTRLCHEMKRRFSVKLDVPSDYADIVLEWPEFLSASAANIGSTTQMVILIDGLDLLENKHGALTMEWLPSEADIPSNVVIMLSCREGLTAHSVLVKRQPPPHQITIGALNMFDKAEMVRRSLSRHRKTLDESPFGNQMKLLLSKKEANNPLYLYLACEELRMFGVFEEVTTRIRNMSPTIGGLLQEILARLEGEHGTELVTAAMSFIAVARDGLQEGELSTLLAVYQAAPQVESLLSGTKYKLPPATIARLFRSIQNYLQQSNQEKSDLLTFSHQDVQKAVQLRYMKGTNSELEKQLHKLLVLYFKSETDPKNDGSYSGKNPRAFAELPYHMYMGGMWKELEGLLTNINYVVNKCYAGLAHRLIEDYTPSVVQIAAGIKREVTKFMQVPKIKEYRQFVSRNLHILTLNPSLTLQQAINEPSTSLISSEATKVLISSSQPHPLIYWKNKPATYSPCHLTITGSLQPINCVAVSQDNELIACGSRDCTVKLYNIQTGREGGTFIGHAGPIMGVCFVGVNHLCSASQDGRLSLWDIRGGHRVEVMSGHSRAVQHCAANQSGKLIVSVSLDCSIKVWKGDSGKLQGTMRTQGYNNKPLNCVAFHPEGQLVAVGGWDTHVKIWDTFNQKRLKVLRGHSTSVQACAYACSGRHIASASLDGEVRLWATKSGATIGTIVGHAQAVTCLAFSDEGALLATGSNDQTLKLWSSTLGTPIKMNSSGDDGPVLCLAGNSKSRQVLAGHRSGVVRMLEIKTRKTATQIPHGDIPVTTISWGPKNDGYCLSGAADGSLRVWELHRVDKRFADLQGHSSLVRCSVWSDGVLASGSEDMTINIWPSSTTYYSKMKKSADPLVVQPNMTLHGHTGPVNSLAISSNGILLASASADMSVILWDTVGFKKVHIFDACHKDWINTCTFSDNNPDLLITGSNDFTLKLWDVKAKTEKGTLTGHSSAVTQVVLQQGCIVSASSDGLVKVWTHKGIEITTMRCHKKRVSGCVLYLPQKEDSSSWADMMADEDEEEVAKRRQAFDLKGAIIVTGSDDGLVGFWRPFVAHKVLTLTGHSDQIKTLALTKENHIVSASTDKTVKVWTPPVASSTLTEVSSTVITYHSGPVVDVSVSTNGEYMASVGRDGVLKIWGNSPSDDSATLVVLHEVVVCEQSEPLGAVCFISDNTVAVASYDCTLTLWRFTEQEPLAKLRKVEMQEKSPITSLVLSKDKKCLIAGAVSGRITTILLSTQRELHLRILHTDYVTAAIGFTGGKLVSTGLDNQLVFWQPDQGRGLKTIDAFDGSTEDNKDRWPTVLTATSTLLFVGDSLGFVLIRKVSHHHEEKQSLSFRVESGKLLLEKKLHAKAIKAITTLTTGDQHEFLLTGSEDCSIKLWKIVDSHHQLGLRQVGQFHCLSPVTTLATTAVTTSGKQLIVGGDILGHLYQLQWN